MGRYGSLDYPKLTKAGFLFGLTLFLGGALGSVIAGSVLGAVPDWLSTALVDAEAVGLIVGFFSPFIFGILLPLTE